MRRCFFCMVAKFSHVGLSYWNLKFDQKFSSSWSATFNSVRRSGFFLYSFFQVFDFEKVCLVIIYFCVYILSWELNLRGCHFFVHSVSFIVLHFSSTFLWVFFFLVLWAFIWKTFFWLQGKVWNLVLAFLIMSIEIFLHFFHENKMFTEPKEN